MKTWLRKNKRAAALAACFALLFCLCACGQAATENAPITAEEAAAFCCAKDDCFLCGNHEGNPPTLSFGQNNVGIVSLNTFAMMPVEINRYDHAGNLIAENTGAMQMRYFKNGDKGFSASLSLDCDRGIANVSITPGEDKRIDLTKAASHLCKDCFQRFAEELDEATYGIGILNLQTKAIRPVRQNITAFGTDDYYIHCDFGEQLNILIALTPLRYSEATEAQAKCVSP